MLEKDSRLSTPGRSHGLRLHHETGGPAVPAHLHPVQPAGLRRHRPVQWLPGRIQGKRPCLHPLCPAAACRYAFRKPLRTLYRREPPFDSLRAPWLYRESTAELIRLLKFQQKLAAGRTLGLLLAQALESEREMPQLLLPVPLHSQQLRERGFNHAAEITRSLSRALGIPWSTRLLSKQRPTAPQHGLNRRERLKNLRNAFHFQQHGDLHHVAVVDDVVTTGSTATEIARLLKRAGVEKVSIWAVARTPMEQA